jgi:membrane-associated phospholipid phosphatase
VNLLARIISIVFHPLLLATYLFALFIFLFPVALEPLKAEGHLTFLFLIFCVTFVLPALNVGMFRMMGTIKSLEMKERKERIIPFIFISVLYVALTYLFHTKPRIGFHDNLLKFMIIIDALVLIATLTTLFYKVSVHSLAVWGLIGILIPLNKVLEDNTLFYPTLFIIVMAGLVMSARLKLNAHTPREVMVGSLLGLATGFAGMVILF